MKKTLLIIIIVAVAFFVTLNVWTWFGCRKGNFKMALVLIDKGSSSEELEEYRNKLDYFKNRTPSAFYFATGGLAKISIPIEPVILSSKGLVDDNGRPQIKNITKEFYKNHPDKFDFITIFSNAGNTRGSNHHQRASNNIKGIGINNLSNAGASYGSNGRLLGVNYLDDTLEQIDDCYKEQKDVLDQFTVGNDCGMWIMLHETGHQWGVFVGDNVGNFDPTNVDLGIRILGSHYNKLLDSPEGTRKLMGGGMRFDKAPDDSVYVNYERDTDLLKYHPFTLYFMGLLPRSQYDTKFNIFKDLIEGYRISDRQGTMAMGGVHKQVSVRDIIEREGSRRCSVFGPTQRVILEVIGFFANNT